MNNCLVMLPFGRYAGTPPIMLWCTRSCRNRAPAMGPDRAGQSDRHRHMQNPVNANYRHSNIIVIIADREVRLR